MRQRVARSTEDRSAECPSDLIRVQGLSHCCSQMTSQSLRWTCFMRSSRGSKGQVREERSTQSTSNHLKSPSSFADIRADRVVQGLIPKILPSRLNDHVVHICIRLMHTLSEIRKLIHSCLYAISSNRAKPTNRPGRPEPEDPNFMPHALSLSCLLLTSIYTVTKRGLATKKSAVPWLETSSIHT